MDSQPTTPAEQARALWVTVFLDRYPLCLKKLQRVDGPQGCMHQAAEEADLAFAEYNQRFGEQP
jgi:hypothetical protein